MKRITFKTLPSGGNIKTWRACGAVRACPGVRFTPLFIYNRTSPLAAPDITPRHTLYPSRRFVRPFDVIKCKCSSPPPVTLTTVLTTPGAYVFVDLGKEDRELPRECDGYTGENVDVRGKKAKNHTRTSLNRPYLTFKESIDFLLIFQTDERIVLFYHR